MVEVTGKIDSSLTAVKKALEGFQRDHSNAEVKIYRYNSASIRIRIVADYFAGIDEIDRHDRVWPYLAALDDDVVEQITVVLILTPPEQAAGRSLMNIEFDDRSPSML